MAMNQRSSGILLRRVGASAILAGLLLTAAALPVGSGSVSVAAAADPSADIPGIPLAGPVAAGRLGGAIYDVVYRVSVPRRATSSWPT